MILTELEDPTAAFRANKPEWAYAPLSGAGAAKVGGRFNRQGIEALYLSLDRLTALDEYQQCSSLLPPCTLCQYTLGISGLVDLRALTDDGQWDADWHNWTADWREQRFNQGITPITWMLGDLAMEQGYKGIIFPSMVRAGGTNLVIYKDMLEPEDKLDVFDDGLLPDDRASWSKRDLR